MARALMWVLALGLLAWAAWLWPDVPARVPVHFGPNGQPDAWADRSVWSWFGVPLVGLALAALAEAQMRWSLARPDAPGINIPNKKAILALPPEKRAPVLARVADIVYGAIAVGLVALTLVQLDVWAVAHGADDAPSTVAISVVALAGSLAVLVVGLVRVNAELKRQQAA